MDESGARVGVVKWEEIVLPIEQKEIHTASPENRKSITIIETISADGKQPIAPAIICLGYRFMENWFHENLQGHELLMLSPTGYTCWKVGTWSVLRKLCKPILCCTLHQLRINKVKDSTGMSVVEKATKLRNLNAEIRLDDEKQALCDAALVTLLCSSMDESFVGVIDIMNAKETDITLEEAQRILLREKETALIDPAIAPDTAFSARFRGGSSSKGRERWNVAAGSFSATTVGALTRRDSVRSGLQPTRARQLQRKEMAARAVTTKKFSL